MAEELSITGNFTVHDPVEAFLRDCPPEAHTMPPRLAERCPDAFKKSLDLILRWGDASRYYLFAYEGFKGPDLVLRTPEVDYESNEGHKGTVFLTANLVTNRQQPEQIISQSISLWAHAGARGRFKEIIHLKEGSIERKGEAGFVNGNHGDLNFFLGVVGSIREKALPEDPKEKLEKAQEQQYKREELARIAFNGLEQDIVGSDISKEELDEIASVVIG